MPLRVVCCADACGVLDSCFGVSFFVSGVAAGVSVGVGVAAGVGSGVGSGVGAGDCVATAAAGAAGCSWFFAMDTAWEQSCVTIKRVANHFIRSPHVRVHILLSKVFGKFVFA